MATHKITTYDVWVGNLPLSADDKNIGKLFSKYGETYSLFSRLAKTGEYKFGFVKYFAEADADKAVAELDGLEFDGKKIIVKRDFKQTGSGKDGEEIKDKPRNKRNLQKPQKKPADLDQLNNLINSLNESNPRSPVKFAGSDGIPSRPFSDSRRDKERESALITHVESPITMWIQTLTEENTERLLNISEQLASLCPAASKVTGPVVTGKIYATMFSEDNQWYRCQLKQSLGSDTLKVQYIDYGNSEEVKNESLVEIPQSLASMKPMATKLILHNCYANDLSDQKAIQWVKELTEGIVVDTVKTVPLKDNTGHYGMLYVGENCVNDNIKELGFAYTRPAMANKTNDVGGQGLLGPGKLMANVITKSVTNDQIIGTGGGYADSGGGGYGDMTGSPIFGGKQNGGRLTPKFNRDTGSPDPTGEVERLRQELAKKNMQLQHVLLNRPESSGFDPTPEMDRLRQELAKKTAQLQQASMTRNDVNTDNVKAMQAQLNKKQRELEKTKTELSSKNSLLQQLQIQKIELPQVTELCNQVRNLRSQFPAGQKSLLDDAISIAQSEDRITIGTVNTLQPAVSLLTRYKLIQKEISNCTDKAELDSMIKTRDEARNELYEKSQECVEQLSALPLDQRYQEVQDTENKLLKDYAPFFTFNVHNNLSLEEMVPGFNDWKAKKDAEFIQIRKLTSSFGNMVEQNIHHVGKMLRLESSDVLSPLPIPWDEMLSRYAQLLQQEILCTNLEQTGDASLIAAVIKAIIKELSNEMKNINHFKTLIQEFSEIKSGIEPWLTAKPNTEELTQIKKTIRGLKSKLRHKEADRQDLEEAGESEEEELASVKSEIKSLKTDLHKALLEQEKTLLSIAKATTEHFPELLCQFEDLGIKSLLAYNGLVTAGRDLDQYTLTTVSWREGLSLTEFAGEPVYLQEYLVGDTDHLDREMFIKNVSRFKEVTCTCQQLPHIQNVFFLKNDRLGYVQMKLPEVTPLLEIVKSQLDIQLRQKIIENIAKAVQCLHEGHIIHGEISPTNIGYTTDGQVVLMCPDLSRSVEDRLKKPYTAENGLQFRCPEVACGRSNGTKATDMYCLGLVILWLYFPSLPIPFKADGYLRLNDLQMDPQIATLLYNLLSNPDCRYRATQVLACDYFKADMSLPLSNQSDSSTEDSQEGSVCTVIDNSLPPCEDIITVSEQAEESFSSIDVVQSEETSYSSINGDEPPENFHPVEHTFPVISQFNPSEITTNQGGEDGMFANSAEMLANCLSQLPPLSDLPGLPDSDQERFKTPTQDESDEQSQSEDVCPLLSEDGDRKEIENEEVDP